MAMRDFGALSSEWLGHKIPCAVLTEMLVAEENMFRLVGVYKVQAYPRV